MQISGASGMMPTFGVQKKPADPADTANFFAPKAEADSAPKAEFLKRARMTAAEQMRASILDSLGIKEDDVKSLSAEDQAKLEAKIKEMIKVKAEQAEAKKGLLVDIKA